MTANLKLLDTRAKRVTHTSLDTIRVTPEIANAWKSPPFQRPLRVNSKVMALAETIKADGGVLPGVLTLGVLERDTYLLDGQHRREAFLQSGCPEGYADIRRHVFESMADMGSEFVGRDPEYHRLWGSLSLTLTFWLYRRLVVTQFSQKTPKLTREQFTRCLQSLSADSIFVDWLHGRLLSDRDRAPCLNRMKTIFAQRLFAELGRKVVLPAPAWSHG